MPIKPENRARYPANWQDIRARILDRAKHRCERCGVPNHSPRANPKTGRIAHIVLTIAHIHDPDPANCADENLQALCQRCHNKLDAPMRAANAATTRRSRKADGDLFDPAPT